MRQHFLQLILVFSNYFLHCIKSLFFSILLCILRGISCNRVFRYLIRMSSVAQVQQVARKLETMLETALTQLKAEQTKRRESEDRLMELELALVNKEHEVKTLEARIEEVSAEREEKVSNLETSVNYLQGVIIEREQEILRLQELNEEIETGINSVEDSEKMTKTVEKFEQTLNKLMNNGRGSSDQHEEEAMEEDEPGAASDMIADESVGVDEEELLTLDESNIMGDNENIADDEEEEYVLEESLEDLEREENDLQDVVKEEVDVKDEKILKVNAFDNVDPKSKVCPVCEIEFSTKGKLREHQKERDHAPRFECDDCGKLFKTKGTLTQHKARIHSDVMPFKCSKCDKRFKDQGSCRRHEANDSVHIR